MLSNNETNSNVVEIQQLQQNNTTLSSEDLLKHMQSLEKRIKSLEVTNRVILGLFIDTLAAAITVGAGFAIAAAPIIAGSIVGGILATAALAALGVTAYKYRAEIKAGFKYAAEKTVDGAKYTAGKVKDASTYAAGKVRDGAVHVKDKVGEGVDSLKKRFKERDRIVFYNHAKEGDAIEKMTKFPEEDRKKAGEIKHELKAIFADKGDNSKLVKNILSEMSLKIDFKIAEEAKSERIEHTPKWQVQKDFIKHLGEKDLRVLIKQKALPSDVYFIDRVFSEHYDEIKEVIAKCKEDYILKGSLKMRNNMFEEGSARPSRSFSLPSFSSLRRNNSEQSNSLPRSSSMSSVRTDSTATVSDSDSQNFATVRRSNSSNSLNASPKLTPAASPKVPESPSTDSGMGSGSSTPTKEQSPSINLDPFGSIDSRGLSDPLIPKKLSPSVEELSKGLDKIMEQLNHDISQLPSTKVGENSVYHPAGVKTK